MDVKLPCGAVPRLVGEPSRLCVGEGGVGPGESDSLPGLESEIRPTYSATIRTLPTLHDPSARFPGKPGNRSEGTLFCTDTPMPILSDIRCSAPGMLLELTFVPDSGTSGPGTFS